MLCGGQTKADVLYSHAIKRSCLGAVATAFQIDASKGYRVPFTKYQTGGRDVSFL